MTDDPRDHADQSISARFTRVMNATTSRFGVLTDPSLVGLVTAPVLIALLAAVRLDADPGVLTRLEALALVPVCVSVAAALSLRGARARVVEWLATLPFPVENMNAVLNGLGEALEVTFRGPAPAAKDINDALDRVSPECFVSKTGDEGDPHVVELRIGVVDSKRNPSASNHRRLVRVQALVREVVAPLAAQNPVVEVRVK
jgi:hypothetical protein